MAKPHSSFPVFVKTSWLSDLNICEFFEFTQDEINLAMIIYNELDKKLCRAVIKDYGKSDFYSVSDKLDRKQTNA